MQQEIHKQVEHELYCSNRQRASLVCCHPNCSNYAFVCRKEACDCIEVNHRNCTLSYAKTIINNINQKKKQIPPKIVQAVQAIQRVYNEAIEKLSKDRQDINLWKENFGLTIDEATFINAIQCKDLSVVKGSMVQSIIANIQQVEDTDFITVEWVQNFWKKGTVFFDNLFATINKIGRMQFKKSVVGKFKWDDKNKLKQITVDQKRVYQSADFNRYIIVQMTPSLSQFPPTVPISWAIKVTGLTDSVGVGICQKKKLISTEYKIEYDHLGHGVFMVHSTGYIFSNSVLQDNYKKKSFEFKQGDTINVRYHPGKNQLTFVKNNNQARVVLATDFPFPGDFFCPCVLLRRENDAAEIVDINPKVCWNSFDIANQTNAQKQVQKVSQQKNQDQESQSNQDQMQLGIQLGE